MPVMPLHQIPLSPICNQLSRVVSWAFYCDRIRSPPPRTLTRTNMVVRGIPSHATLRLDITHPNQHGTARPFLRETHLQLQRPHASERASSRGRQPRTGWIAKTPGRFTRSFFDFRRILQIPNWNGRRLLAPSDNSAPHWKSADGPRCTTTHPPVHLRLAHLRSTRRTTSSRGSPYYRPDFHR